MKSHVSFMVLAHPSRTIQGKNYFSSTLSQVFVIGNTSIFIDPLVLSFTFLEFCFSECMTPGQRGKWSIFLNMLIRPTGKIETIGIISSKPYIPCYNLSPEQTIYQEGNEYATNVSPYPPFLLPRSYDPC